MFDTDTLPDDYGAPVHPSARTMASPTPGQMPGYGAASSGAVPIPPWTGSGNWTYQMAADGTITVLSEPSGRYKGLKRTAADGRAYDAIVSEATKRLPSQFAAAVAGAAAQNRAKFATQYAAALKPTAPSTPTFAPIPGGIPGADPLAPPTAPPAGAFYEQWWFPPAVAVGVLSIVGLGIWYTSGKRK